LTTLLSFIFVLGVVVFVHELGHFLVARWHGIRVLTFSLGFGPKVFTVRRGDTDYCLSAIPLGGYVKMAGENPDDPRTGRQDEFLSKGKWQRFQVLVAGATMNVLLALVVMTFVLHQGADVPAYEEQPPVVGSVVEGSPAKVAGVQPGDQIVSVQGRDVATWNEAFMAMAPLGGQRVDLVVQRGSERLALSMTAGGGVRFQPGDVGVLPELHPQVMAVTRGEPADKAGIVPGDVVLAVGGEPITQDMPLVKRINESAGVPLRLTIRRGTALRDVEVTPAKKGAVGLIGVQLSPFEVRRIDPTFVQAIGMSAQRNLEWSTLIFQTIKGLVSGEASPRQLVGPVGIAQLSGGAAQMGWLALFTFMAMISLNLGIVNLLPIPVLDGGHIFILALEGLARRDFSMRLKEQMLMAGFMVLMVLMVTVIYNDLTRIEWIERLMPWR
jgi:regulator of sigma E protease